MNNLQTFQYLDLGEIRTIKINNEPWFVAKDVCNILGIKNSRDSVKRLDSDEKNTVVLTDGIRKPYEINS